MAKKKYTDYASKNTKVEELSEPFDGVVSNCVKLNVRREPSVDSEVITIIESSTEVLVNKDESTEDWYKVYLTDGNGVEGFCMKEFISLMQ